jgi:hypothetical protein
MTLCQVCKQNPVTLKGASTCSLKCSLVLDKQDPKPVMERLKAETDKAKSRGISPRMNRANAGLLL